MSVVMGNIFQEKSRNPMDNRPNPTTKKSCLFPFFSIGFLGFWVRVSPGIVPTVLKLQDQVASLRFHSIPALGAERRIARKTRAGFR